ncbi:MAG: 50S ribosomal protein L24 [Candidatus Lokiarchaeota archaeon]|nr:50S ribosomal protein L24 [Candidatus Lokiarchaeota archaeon]
MKNKTKKPKKQRKRLHNLPNHRTSKLFVVRLDELMMQEWGIKRIPLRVDDEVRVIDGELEGVEGKVLSLHKRTGKIEIEECTLEKKNGATYYVPISPNSVVLTKFGGKKMDPWRQKVIDRKEKLLTEDQLEKTATAKKGG